MKILITPLIIALTFICFTSQSQQLGIYNLYNQNIYLINPAAAGLEDCFSGFVNHRTQWRGIDSSPSFSGVTLDGRFAKTHGIGANLQFSDLGLLSQFSGKLTYTYHIRIRKNSYLHAGISLGMNNQMTNTQDIIATDYTDQLIYEGASEWGFVNDVGIMFTTDRLRLGISVPQSFNVGHEIKTGSGENVNLYAAFDIISNDIWKLENSVLYRNNAEPDDQIDIAAKLMWKNIIALGVLYRSNFGLASITELNINDKFVIAYSYDFGGANTISGSGGSHGFMLGIKLGRKRDFSPSYKQPVSNVQEIEMTPVNPIVEEFVEVKNEVKEILLIDQKAKSLALMDSANQVFAQRDQLIRFEHASDEIVISGNQMRVINKVVEILNADSNLHVHIVGHASSVGSTELNQRISEGRAKLIAKELIKKGIDPIRIKHFGRGEEEPLSNNTSEVDAAENRRVQIIFIYVE